MPSIPQHPFSLKIRRTIVLADGKEGAIHNPSKEVPNNGNMEIEGAL
jgi:hypothetical protein